MAINRITPITYPSGGFQDWAYIDDTPAGATMFDFIADGTEDTNTVANARYRVLQYFSPGSFSLTLDRPGKLDFLMVAGGGSGGSQGADNQNGHYKGGGGAGGFILNYNYIPTSPQFSITVGAGGISSTSGGNGQDTIFGSFTAVGGGRGGINENGNGYSGGSGGGGSRYGAGGAGTLGQGNNGGYNSTGGGGGGGGAGGTAGSEGGSIVIGGPGIRKNFDGIWRWYAAGGNSANSTYNSQGQTPYQVHADTGNPDVPGAGGGGDYYGGGGTDIWSKRGNKGIVLIRFRVA